MQLPKPAKRLVTADLTQRFYFFDVISYTYIMNAATTKETTYRVVHEMNDAGDKVVSEAWYLNGELSRTNGPALTFWCGKTGQKLTESWYSNGVLHRRDGPAYIQYVEGHNEMIYREEWNLDGRLWRVGGPARTTYNPQTGNPDETEYYPPPPYKSLSPKP